jgi:flagellin-like protein
MPGGAALRTLKRRVHPGEEAVSPVIGTILMVAVTVILAAILYVVVGPLINPDEEPPEDVVLLSQGSVNGDGAGGYDTFFTVMEVRSNNRYTDTDISFIVMTDDGTLLTDATVTFDDANANGYVSQGDSILVRGMTLSYQGADLKMLHQGDMIGIISIFVQA